MRGYPDGQLAKNLVFFGAKIGVPLPFEPKRTLSTFLHGILFGQFLPDEFTDVAAENIDLTAKLPLPRPTGSRISHGTRMDAQTKKHSIRMDV